MYYRVDNCIKLCREDRENWGYRIYINSGECYSPNHPSIFAHKPMERMSQALMKCLQRHINDSPIIYFLWKLGAVKDHWSCFFSQPENLAIKITTLDELSKMGWSNVNLHNFIKNNPIESVSHALRAINHCWEEFTQLCREKKLVNRVDLCEWVRQHYMNICLDKQKRRYEIEEGC